MLESASLLTWLFILLLALWVVKEGINHLLGKGTRLGQAWPEDGGSYWLLISAALFSLMLVFGSRAIGATLLPTWLRYSGVGLMAAGLILRQWAVFSLGRHFSVVVAIESDHQLIQSGPYRWLRHPAYTGGLLAAMGMQLIMGNGWTLLLSVLMLLPAFAYRMRIEERTLLAHFGEAYRAYRQETWGLLPWW
jgi:protein-S-isoprenylcysteine O-methyltransferase Ste14